MGNGLKRFIVSVALLIAVADSALASEPRIEILYRGAALKFGHAFLPYRAQSTVLVPFREVSTLVGATIMRAPDGKHVTLTFGKNTVYYEPGHHGYRLNGKRQDMRASSEMRQKRLYVPVRLFTDLTSGKVHAEIL